MRLYNYMCVCVRVCVFVCMRACVHVCPCVFLFYFILFYCSPGAKYVDAAGAQDHTIALTGMASFGVFDFRPTSSVVNAVSSCSRMLRQRACILENA